MLFILLTFNLVIYKLVYKMKLSKNVIWSFATFITACFMSIHIFKISITLTYKFEFTRNSLILIVSNLLFLALFLLAYPYVIRFLQKYTLGNTTQKNRNRWMFFLSTLTFLAILLALSSRWMIQVFGDVGMEQLIYALQTSIGGANFQQIDSFINAPLVNSLFLTFLTMFLVNLLIDNCRSKILLRKHKWGILLLLSIGILVPNTVYAVHQFSYEKLTAYFNFSNFIEDEYVNPKEVSITFPEQKRNLIYIYVESLETTYLSKNLGGVQAINLLPELTELANQPGNLNFSNTNKLGGSYAYTGTDYTVAGIVAQTTGMPLKTSPELIGTEDLNAFGNSEEYKSGKKKFLNGIYSLGDILNKEGYNQSIVMGSDADFASRRSYFTDHGNYKILDLIDAKKTGKLPSDYYVWWGYEDSKLFEYAKEEATNLSNQNKPFNLSLLTANTHFEDGYKELDSPQPYDDHYSNVISYSSQQIAEFITWCQQQPFYENTTIILSGDHLSMDRDFFDDVSKNYQRTVFNLFINSPVTTENNKNRKFSTMDLFPSTLAALNADIEGDKLALGTNLFSNKKTLTETYGPEKMEKELSQKSRFYFNHIIE